MERYDTEKPTCEKKASELMSMVNEIEKLNQRLESAVSRLNDCRRRLSQLLGTNEPAQADADGGTKATPPEANLLSQRHVTNYQIDQLIDCVEQLERLI